MEEHAAVPDTCEPQKKPSRQAFLKHQLELVDPTNESSQGSQGLQMSRLKQGPLLSPREDCKTPLRPLQPRARCKSALRPSSQTHRQRGRQPRPSLFGSKTPGATSPLNPLPSESDPLLQYFREQKTIHRKYKSLFSDLGKEETDARACVAAKAARENMPQTQMDALIAEIRKDYRITKRLLVQQQLCEEEELFHNLQAQLGSAQ